MHFPDSYSWTCCGKSSITPARLVGAIRAVAVSGGTGLRRFDASDVCARLDAIGRRHASLLRSQSPAARRLDWNTAIAARAAAARPNLSLLQ